MQDLTNQRCFNHMHREAVARCPGCDRYFCRECITEHEDEVLCAVCLGKGRKPTEARLYRLEWLFRLGHFLLGFTILYVFIFYFALILLSLPSSFHEGTMWKPGW